MSDAGRELEKSKMARFDEKSGNLYVTELGRVASHFYIKHSSIVTYNELLKPHMSETDVSWHTKPDLGIPCTCHAIQMLYVNFAMIVAVQGIIRENMLCKHGTLDLFLRCADLSAVVGWTAAASTKLAPHIC